MTDCKDRLVKRAKFPSEVDFPWFESTYKDNGARAIFVSRAKLMNGFGAKIPHFFKCVYEIRDDRLAVLHDFQMREG